MHTSHHARRVGLLLSTALAAALLGGCPQSALESVPTATTATQVLAAGSAQRDLSPNELATFEIDVPAGLALELTVAPSDGATVGLASVVAPDGASFSARAGESKLSADRRFSVGPQSAGADGIGLRFAGQSETGGTWRLSFYVRPSERYAVLRATARERSISERAALLALLAARGPAAADEAPRLLQWAFPSLDELNAPVALRLSVNIADADEVNFDPPTLDGGGSSGGSNGDGSDGAGDPNSDGSAGDSGGDPNSGGSDGGSGGDPNSGGGAGDDPNSGGGDSGANDDGIPDTPPPANLTSNLVVQTGDAVPGVPGATFRYFSNPVIDAEGRVAFWAGLRNGAAPAGLFVWQNGTLTRILDTNPNNKGVVPDKGPTAFWGTVNVQWDAGSPQLSWGTAGRLIFTAYFNASPLPNGLFRWRASDGDLLHITDCDELATLFSNFDNSMLCEFYNPALSDEGIVAFANRYTYFATDGSLVFRKRGMFSSNGVTLKPLVAPGIVKKGAVPEQGANASYSGVEFLPTINPAGDVIFQAQFQGGSVAGASRGVYRLSGSTVSRVIDNSPGVSWPGLPAGTQVGVDTAYDAVAINKDRRIVLDTRVTPQGGSPRDAVLVFDGTNWREVLANGQPATDLLSGLNAAGQALALVGGLPFITDGVTTLPLAANPPATLAGNSVTWEGFGGAMNNNSRGALRFRRASGSSGIAFWTGEKMIVVADPANFVPAGTFTEVFALTRPNLENIDKLGVLKDRPEVDRSGRSSALNDRDELVYRVGSLGADGNANTTDDYQAIFIARP